MADMLKSMMAAIGLAEDDAALWGSPTELATKDELLAARDALKSYDDVLRTPQLNDWPVGDTTLTLKLESLQTTGSFKIRGMRYKLHVSDVERLRSAGVVTLSAGNAGKAVSYLAGRPAFAAWSMTRAGSCATASGIVPEKALLSRKRSRRSSRRP